MSGRGSGFPFKGGERDQETQAHRALLEGVDQGWGKGREGEGSTSQMGNGGGGGGQDFVPLFWDLQSGDAKAG